jgi:hypothetical protein
MAKPEKSPDDEVTTNFFGINPKTYEIESVSLTRGGTLLRVGDGADNWSATVPVAAARHEIAVRLGLVEIVETSAQTTGEELRRKIIEDLETKAEIMKQENSE